MCNVWRERESLKNGLAPILLVAQLDYRLFQHPNSKKYSIAMCYLSVTFYHLPCKKPSLGFGVIHFLADQNLVKGLIQLSPCKVFSQS